MGQPTQGEEARELSALDAAIFAIGLVPTDRRPICAMTCVEQTARIAESSRAVRQVEAILGRTLAYEERYRVYFSSDTAALDRERSRLAESSRRGRWERRTARS
jgi:hypothetical protein